MLCGGEVVSGRHDGNSASGLYAMSLYCNLPVSKDGKSGREETHNPLLSWHLRMEARCENAFQHHVSDKIVNVAVMDVCYLGRQGL